VQYEADQANAEDQCSHHGADVDVINTKLAPSAGRMPTDRGQDPRTVRPSSRHHDRDSVAAFKECPCHRLSLPDVWLHRIALDSAEPNCLTAAWPDARAAKFGHDLAMADKECERLAAQLRRVTARPSGRLRTAR